MNKYFLKISENKAKITTFFSWFFPVFFVILWNIFIIFHFFKYSLFFWIFFIILGVIFILKNIFKDRFKNFILEYKFYKILRDNVKMPFLRWIFSILIFFVGIIFIFLPFPWAFIPGIFMFSIWIILIIKVDKLRHLIKLRRSIIYLFSNIFKKKERTQKIRDIKKHLWDIFEKEKNPEKKEKSLP